MQNNPTKTKRRLFTDEEVSKAMERLDQEKPKLGLTKKRRIVYMNILRDIAQSHKGSVLSRSYQNMVTPMQFRCAVGHKFEALPLNVTRGHWCPTCAYRKRLQIVGPKHYARLKEIVTARGGRIISPASAYQGAYSILKFECKEGHIWETRATIIKRGKWCPTCGRKKASSQYTKDRRARGDKLLQAAAEARGGKCLGPRFTILKAKYIFECKRGHVWETTGNSVLRMKTWCPECAKIKE